LKSLYAHAPFFYYFSKAFGRVQTKRNKVYAAKLSQRFVRNNKGNLGAVLGVVPGLRRMAPPTTLLLISSYMRYDKVIM
jgi:hypothetical protein